MPSALIVSGSPTFPSKFAALGEHAGCSLQEMGITVTHVRLRDLPSEALLSCDAKHPKIAAESSASKPAVVFVFVTPIYKASFSGLIKLFIDLLPQFALKDKVVMPLATAPRWRTFWRWITDFAPSFSLWAHGTSCKASLYFNLRSTYRLAS